MAQPVTRSVLRSLTLSSLPSLSHDIEPGPLVVTGFHKDLLGIGKASRLTLQAMKAAGYTPIAHDARATLRGEPAAQLPFSLPGGAWILQCNPPEALTILSKLPRRLWEDRYRIGYWAWELPRAPERWRQIAGAFHEIWTPSEFVAQALRPFGRPVRVMPHPVDLSGGPGAPRPGEGPVEVLSIADLRSSADRKNLLGAAALFARAFPERDGRARLTLKVVRPRADGRAFAELREAVAAHRDMRIVTDELSERRLRALIAQSDIILSPHRAEGFGLLIAEAFAAHRPALATGWSGNMDYMAGLDDLHIPARFVPVTCASGVYKRQRGQVWAEPDLDEGARRLRLLAERPTLRARLAERGLRRLRALSRVWQADALAETAIGRYCERTPDAAGPRDTDLRRTA